jgi:tRNA1Val (adenine37-N6)-methyltransferase
MTQRIDEIGFGGKRLKQDKNAFCYGIDAVLLADFCEAGDGEKILDLCTGNGVIPVILSALSRPSEIVGIDFQEAAVLLAEENAALNGLDNLRFICADIAEDKGLPLDASFDLVSCNPPYFEKGRGLVSSASAKLVARHETTASLEDFVVAAAAALKNGGRFCMVHRPSRLADIMETVRKHGLEPKRLRMVAPYIKEAPNILLIECIKGAGKELKILPELVVRTEDGQFTEEIKRIYAG